MSTGYANRGKAFEFMIEISNRHYSARGLALITQVPTPTTVIQKGSSTHAFRPAKSTVDFVGLLKGGRGIAFDAKSTQQATRFDLAKTSEHQVHYLHSFSLLGGAAFFLIEMSTHKKVFLVPASYMWDCWRLWMTGQGAASIPLERIVDFPEAVSSTACPVDYLKALSDFEQKSQ